MKRKTEATKKKCPECKSSNIYKRSRVYDLTPREKSRASVVKTKIYRCINCAHEFNNPIID